MTQIKLTAGRTVACAVLLTVMLGSVAIGQAAAAVPWWHVVLGATPTRLQPNVQHSQVDQLTIAASGGTLLLVAPEKGAADEVKYNATSEEMRSALEQLYGAGTVAVTGGPGDAVGSHPYRISFTGMLADAPASLIAAPFFLTEEVEVEGKLVVEPTGEKGATLVPLQTAVAAGSLHITADDVGDADAKGEGPKGEPTPIDITDKLPPGLRATTIEGYQEAGVTGTKVPLECGLSSLTCRFTGSLAAYTGLQVVIGVATEPTAAAAEENQATVSGGGASSVTAADSVESGGSVGFGLETTEASLEDEGGTADRQAGSHPFQFTTTVALNQTNDPSHPPALAKDLRFKLPPGLTGNATAVPQCTEAQFLDSYQGVNKCPAATAVGVIAARVYDLLDLGGTRTLTVPIFNVTPSHGEPARFGFDVDNVPAYVDTSVRTGSDYGVTAISRNIPQAVTFISAIATFWGVPNDASHDAQRGWSCINDDGYLTEVPSLPPCLPLGEAHPRPLLTLPTGCGTSLQVPVEADSWASPDLIHTYPSNSLPSVVGCDRLAMRPSIEVAPDGTAASTPTGAAVRIRVPQEGSGNPQALAVANVRTMEVTLPAGMQLSPGSADGLAVCTLGEIGFTGLNPITAAPEYTGELPTPLEPGVTFCPEAAKIATVTIKTPLLSDPLLGAVYLAAPQNFRATGPLENPFHELLVMYIVAQDPESGVLVKLAGHVTATEPNGQLVATFEHLPDVPFEEAELHFFGAGRAPLSTPAACGVYTTTAVVSPWSGQPPVTMTSPFEINTGPDGTGATGCSSPRAFAPGFTAGSSNLQSGAFTPFTMTLTRPDQDQQLAGVELQMPPGFSGDLSNVKLCGEPQAAQGTCGAESLIGETTVSAGLGGNPYTVTGGKVYLTTAYGGGNFGLSIVNPAQAGPFILQEGRPVIVRAGLFIDRHTAAVRVKSDPLPTIIEGIPLQIQHVNVTLNREKFAFNPTDCKPLKVSGTLTSSEGASSDVSNPFQVTNCANLAFAPKLTASVQAKASKKDGASLHVKLTYPAGPQDANIAKVKVDLPLQLPTEQRTLTKACLAKVFEANPANCPKYSIVGHAKAKTPILPVPLEGPAYFVSYGSEKFPNLVIVLQGYGITIDLVGTTFISKQGITSSTFNSVPDQPVGSFELSLPAGPYSALAANLPHNKQNFCGTKLNMPTAFVAQNGVEKHLTTPITVTGCPKPHKAKSKGSTKSKKG